MDARAGDLPVNRRVGVVEDDGVLRENLFRGLGFAGFTVAWAVATAGEALQAAASDSPDVVIVDRGLPDADGLDLIVALRSRGVVAPVIALTARGTSSDVLTGFEAGVDDYLTKPFVFAELLARLEVVLRRTPQGPVGTGLVLDPLSHALCSAGESRALTPTEYNLLAALLLRRDRVLRRAALKLAGWPAGAAVSDNTLDSYIARLRAHVRGVGSPWVIETVRGVGYRIQPCG